MVHHLILRQLLSDLRNTVGRKNDLPSQVHLKFSGRNGQAGKGPRSECPHIRNGANALLAEETGHQQEESAGWPTEWTPAVSNHRVVTLSSVLGGYFLSTVSAAGAAPRM